MIPGPTYRGRFAPTPSGPLHLGSLLTALASYLQAKSHGGIWLLRIDDLDRPRCPPGAADQIIRQLESHGLHWDESLRWQSHHLDEYHAALENLEASNLLYPCNCSRAQLAIDTQANSEEPRYAETCRQRGRREVRHSLRLRTDDSSVTFSDGWQGLQKCNLRWDIGDFVVRRTDGLVAYQLACCVDEHAQAITEVVRGTDLMASSFRQLQLMKLLNLPAPAYRHLPVLLNAQGLKLSKQNHAAPITAEHAGENLYHCLQLLNQSPPATLREDDPEQVLNWARIHWDARQIRSEPSVRALF